MDGKPVAQADVEAARRKLQLWYLESFQVAFMFSVINKILINALNASRSLAPVR